MRALLHDSNTSRQARRRDRFALREGLWDASKVSRLRRCGRRRVEARRPVEVWELDGVGHLTNVALCGSIWACPVCAPKIRAERASEIEDGGEGARHEGGLKRWLAEGHGCEFVTCTIPHDAGDRLRPLLKAVSESWSAVISGRAWVGTPEYVTWAGPDGVKGRSLVGRRGSLRDNLGMVGSIRALEVTLGEAGWHPHVHVLMLTDRPLEGWQRDQLLAHVARVWGASAERFGYRRPSDAHGVTISPVTTAADVARYTAKVDDERGVARSVGNEMTRGDLKEGRRKGRAPFQLLSGAVVDGDADDLEAWREYEADIAGQRAIVWSKGLKALLCVPDRTDEEITEAPVGGNRLGALGDVEWKACQRTRGALARLHEAADTGRAEVVATFLAEVVGEYLAPPP